MRLSKLVRSVASASRWESCFEAVLIVAATLIVNLSLYPASPGFHCWPFNPYLLGPIIVGGRYGILAALFTSVLAGGCYLGTIVMTTTGWTSLRFLTPWHFATPLSLVITAMLVGGFVSRIKRHLGDSVRAFDELDEHFERLSHLHMLVIDEKHLLDKQVLSEEKGFETMVRLFDELDRLSPRRILERVLVLAPMIVGGGEASLYEVRREKRDASKKPEEGVQHTLRRVMASTGDWPETVRAEHPLVEGALRRDGAVALSHLQGWMEPGRAKTESIQLACRVPRSHADHGLCILMRNLPFAAFAPARLNALAVSLRVAGKALQRARTFRRLQDRNVEDATTRASSLAYFNKRLNETLHLSQRHKMPVSVITVHTNEVMSHGTGREKMQFRRSFARALVGSLRQGDLVSYSRRTRAFHILLPFTPADGGSLVSDRLRAEMKTAISSRVTGRKMAVPEVSVVSMNGGEDVDHEGFRRSIFLPRAVGSSEPKKG